mmetsp:Transcript_18312/g.57603  ORF Transcript_18312/g.57603 Transcript_18312/m.57603 type:complete len:239 (+) Transcript_18312:168-884(+)
MAPEDLVALAMLQHQLGDTVREEDDAAEHDDARQVLGVGQRGKERHGPALREAAHHDALRRHALGHDSVESRVDATARGQGLLQGAAVAGRGVRGAEGELRHVEPTGGSALVASHALHGRTGQEEAARAGLRRHPKVLLQHVGPALLRVAEAVHPDEAAARLARPYPSARRRTRSAPKSTAAEGGSAVALPSASPRPGPGPPRPSEPLRIPCPPPSRTPAADPPSRPDGVKWLVRSWP